MNGWMRPVVLRLNFPAALDWMYYLRYYYYLPDRDVCVVLLGGPDANCVALNFFVRTVPAFLHRPESMELPLRLVAAWVESPGLGRVVAVALRPFAVRWLQFLRLAECLSFPAAVGLCAEWTVFVRVHARYCVHLLRGESAADVVGCLGGHYRRRLYGQQDVVCLFASSWGVVGMKAVLSSPSFLACPMCQTGWREND